MELQDSGCCEGHRCDDCDICRSGTCCGADVAEPNLPRQGSYPHDWHGELGVLLEKDGKVQCHICGNWYVELGRHTATKHKVNAETYRAYFGLAIGRALCPEWFSEKRRAKAKQEKLGSQATPITQLTSEQRSLLSYRREARLETAIDRRKHLASISKKGNDTRWATQREQSAYPKIKLRRYPKE